MLICDTSGLLAYFDASDAFCATVSAVVEGDPGPFVVSPFVLAELDYILATRRGAHVELMVLAELFSGAWELPCLETEELHQACALMDRYRDQDIGLTDASIVVLAGRYGTRRILSLDRRHFDVVRSLDGEPFIVLPDPA